MTSRTWSWVLTGVLALASSAAVATFHTFQIQEVYSDASGAVQYIVLRESEDSDGEHLFKTHGISSSSGAAYLRVPFPTNLPNNRTAGKYVLIGTQSFAALGLIAPDYLVPDGFVHLTNGLIDFANVDEMAYPALPTDGVNALYRDGTSKPNLATNFAGATASVVGSSGPPATTPAVEYYYAAWDYYFVTAFPDEIAVLDGGAFGGVWKRTGETFNVWPTPAPASSATCRFFSTSFAPKSSHFYTPFATECDTVKASPDWQFESIAFYIQQAAADGTCPSGTIPLYRQYNNGIGGAPNHRYTTSLTVFNAMAAAGWVFEGNGNTKVFACVPP